MNLEGCSAMTKKKKNTIKVDNALVPGREWKWNETETCFDGVHTFEGQLVWFTHYSNPHAGCGNTQSFSSFLDDGPNVSNAPMEIVNELRCFLLENIFHDKVPRKYKL